MPSKVMRVLTLPQLLKELNMVDEREVRARRALIILLAAGRTEALAMDNDRLDTALADLCIEHVGHQNNDDDDGEAAESFYHGVEMALFVQACAKLRG